MSASRHSPVIRAALAALATVGPIALLVAFAIAASLASRLVGSAPSGAAGCGASLVARTLVSLAVLVVGSALIYLFVRWMASLRAISRPRLGRLSGFGWGTLAGLAASVASALSFYLVRRPTLASSLATALRPAAAISNAGVAALEEVAFRAGVVHVFAAAWGRLAGLLAGSVPFGVLHLVGVFFGRPPSLAHVIGVSAGGWLLSLLYLEHGLVASFACHWVWNTLAVNWVAAFQLPRATGMMQLEQAFTTCVVLVALCALIHWRARRRRELRASG